MKREKDWAFEFKIWGPMEQAMVTNTTTAIKQFSEIGPKDFLF